MPDHEIHETSHIEQATEAATKCLDLITALRGDLTRSRPLWPTTDFPKIVSQRIEGLESSNRKLTRGINGCLDELIEVQSQVIDLHGVVHQSWHHAAATLAESVLKVVRDVARLTRAFRDVAEREFPDCGEKSYLAEVRFWNGDVGIIDLETLAASIPGIEALGAESSFDHTVERMRQGLTQELVKVRRLKGLIASKRAWGRTETVSDQFARENAGVTAAREIHHADSDNPRPQKAPPILNVSNAVVEIDGQNHHMTEDGARVVATLAAAYPRRLPSRELRRFQDSSERPDRIINRLPDAVRALISSRTGVGGGFALTVAMQVEGTESDGGSTSGSAGSSVEQS